MKKRTIAFLILAVMVLGTGCKKKEAPKETEPKEEPKTEEVKEEEADRTGQKISYLTGDWVDKEKGERRPVAVMFGNTKEACPQTGLSLADVVYEVPVEGAMTRLMGIIEDYAELEKIGSVRSCRNYFAYYSAEFDSIYVHYGQSEFAKPLLGSIDNLNGVDSSGDGVFYRSSDRKAPHNAYASAEGIKAGIEKHDYRTAYEEGHESHYQFASEGDTVELENAETALKVEPGYQINKPWFEYDEGKGVYYRYQYGDKQVDNLDNTHVSYENIIMQYSANTMYDDKCLNIDTISGGSGKYITKGKAIDITWTKDSEWGVTRYYDENGDEITLNIGKTWVCVIQNSKTDQVDISD